MVSILMRCFSGAPPPTGEPAGHRKWTPGSIRGLYTHPSRRTASAACGNCRAELRAAARRTLCSTLCATHPAAEAPQGVGLFVPWYVWPGPLYDELVRRRRNRRAACGDRRCTAARRPAARPPCAAVAHMPRRTLPTTANTTPSPPPRGAADCEHRPPADQRQVGRRGRRLRRPRPRAPAVAAAPGRMGPAARRGVEPLRVRMRACTPWRQRSS